MTIPFQNILFLKEFLACNDCFRLFTKIKRGQGLTFGAHLLHDFTIKMFHIFFHNVTLSMDKVSMLYISSFSTYQAKCITKFLFRQLMILWTLRFILDQALKQWLTERKRGEDGNKKFFHSFWRTIIWW